MHKQPLSLVGHIGRTLPAEPRRQPTIRAPFDAPTERLDAGRSESANQAGVFSPDDALKKRVSTVQARFCRLGHLLDTEPHAPLGCTWFLMKWRGGRTGIVRSLEEAEALADRLDGAGRYGHCWWTEGD